MSNNSRIIVCGGGFDVGQRVVTFLDDPSISAYTLHRTDRPGEIYPFKPARGLGASAYRYRPRRLIGQDRSLSRLQKVVRQFVVHHDGCEDSRTCFHVLHNERGLSVHFLIDNDGTIFQTLDLVDCAFQAAGVNEISIGVELANRGDALRFPGAYRGGRDKVTCRVQGHQFLAWSYTHAQLDSMTSLGRTLARLFPNLPQTFPHGGDHEPVWNALGDPRGYAGYLGHYHVTQQKWDPGPFDFKRFTATIRSRTVFPLVPAATAAIEIPDDKEQADELAGQLYGNNEDEGEGGYYPVGPLGASRLWHGGVHLRAERGTPVYAPFAGKLVAARMADDCAVGSRNFVLLRHDLAVGATPVRFWTLLFHLDLEGGAGSPAWFQRAGSKLGDDPAALDIEVAAGELVGHVGEAGPPGRFEGQLHVEVMSRDEIGAKLEPGFWHTVDGSKMGRFCSAHEIIDAIDKPAGGARDGVLSRAELLAFFRGDPGRLAFRRLAVRHLSEWADDNDWRAALSGSPDFAALPPAVRGRIFQEQIEPTLWWTDEVVEAAGLPPDKLVWSYHAVTFLTWMHDQLRGGTTAAKGIGAESTFEGKAPPREIRDDGDATEGFTDDEDVLAGDAGRKLELEDLAAGYPDEQP